MVTGHRSETRTIQFKYAQYQFARTLPRRPATNRQVEHFQTQRNPVQAQNILPTEADIALVRRTFDFVVPIAGVAADLFYELSLIHI